MYNKCLKYFNADTHSVQMMSYTTRSQRMIYKVASNMVHVMIEPNE